MDPVHFYFCNRVALNVHFDLLELCICYNRESEVESVCDFHEFLVVELQIDNCF